MLSVRTLYRLACVGLCVAGMARIVAAQPSVTVSPATVKINPGETVTVNVLANNISPLHPLHAADVAVSFDNTVITLTSSAVGGFLASGGASVFSSPLVTSNTVTYNLAILGAGMDVSGSGTLYSLTFTGAAKGISAITLTTVDLREFIAPDGQALISASSQGGNVTVGPTVANVKGYLQGPFASGSMSVALRTASLVPLSQPYGGTPWSYGGTEAVASIPASVVDWVLVELRTGTGGATKVATRAAFIKSDGSIVDLDGSSAVAFPGTIASGNYYIVVRHRNHLAVMSAGVVALSPTSGVYDFTTGTDKYYGADAKLLTGGVYGLYAGDVTGDGIVKYNGGSNDRLPILTKIGGGNVNTTVSGYWREDVNLDGIVKYNGGTNDRLIIFQVIGGTNVSSTKLTQVPN